MQILRNVATSETLELTLWRDEETRRKSGQKGELLEWKLQSLAAITGQMLTIENYDLWPIPLSRAGIGLALF
jgi:hypothetical protein